MKKISFKLLALATIFATAGGLQARTNVEDDATLNQISGYRQWTRINQQPVIVPVVLNVPDSVAV